jgi:hypothetical protein
MTTDKHLQTRVNVELTMYASSLTMMSHFAIAARCTWRIAGHIGSTGKTHSVAATRAPAFPGRQILAMRVLVTPIVGNQFPAGNNVTNFEFTAGMRFVRGVIINSRFLCIK